MPHFEEVYNAIIETNTEHAAQLYLGAPVRSDDDYDDLDDEELDDEDSKGQMKGSAITDPFVEHLYQRGRSSRFHRRRAVAIPYA